MTPPTVLMGREAECALLEGLLETVRDGESRVLVLRGEPGVGKTALLDHLVGSASGCRVARAAGVEHEMELAYAGLHQLCAPVLELRERLPDPQREALATAFGLSAEAPPDRFVVGLAVLSLLSEVAEEQPLLCVIDDAQWLDTASSLSLAFVGRRLLAERIGLVFAVREPSDVRELTGLDDVSVAGLGDDDARALLDSALPDRLDERVRELVIAESRGNPLALLELPRDLTPGELAGGFGLSDVPLATRLEQRFRKRLEPLPAETQRLLLTAAAEPFGDVSLLWRAADRLGLGPDVAAPAEAVGLVEIRAQVRFRHPLVRSAVYHAASVPDRREAHRALAESIDADTDPDRHAWHRAQAAPGPDEDVAAELERSADRALARGGVAASAAFLQRASALSPAPARRAQRALQAAQAKLQAGAFDQAAALLAMADAGPLDELGRARIDLLRAQTAFAQHRGAEAPPLLLAAARRFERLDVELARETYLDAVSAAVFSGRLSDDPSLKDVGESARGAPHAERPRPSDRLLDAFAVRLTEGYEPWAPVAARALTAFADEELSVPDALRWLWLGSVIAADLWDDDRWHEIALRHVAVVREAGGLSELPRAFDSLAVLLMLAGDLPAAASLVDQVSTVCEATGIDPARIGPIALAAFRGREREARPLIDATLSLAEARGQGAAVGVTHWLQALLCNGLGMYEDAVVSGRIGASHPQGFASTRWAMIELIEGAVRSGQLEVATEGLERLSVSTRASDTEWGRGVEARLRAMLVDGDAAEERYREAIERLGRTRIRTELARAHLVYGEWLRRARRRTDAREHLRRAYELLNGMGLEGFAERARRELAATGETVRPRSEAAKGLLTPQEAQVARLAREGLSNPEIGAQLFISPRTVQYHLRKVFLKLDITSRAQLGRVPEDRINPV